MFEVIGQCFSIAQDRMCELWKKDADLVVEPNVNGFAYDCFDRAKDLTALGESSVRAIVPQLRTMLNLPDPDAIVASLPATFPSPAIQPGIMA
jgi:hypothetical protein